VVYIRVGDSFKKWSTACARKSFFMRMDVFMTSKKGAYFSGIIY